MNKMNRLSLVLLLVALAAPAAAQVRAQPQMPPNPAAASAVTIEAEALMGSAQASHGQLSVQGMAGFGPGWGGNAQLFWRPPAPVGAPVRIEPRLTLGFSVPAAGRYQLLLAHTVAPDYGIVAVEFPGVARGQIDGYAPGVERRELFFGTFDLPAGPMRVQFTLLGKSAMSSGHLVGIDRIELRPAQGALPAAAAAAGASAVAAQQPGRLQAPPALTAGNQQIGQPTLLPADLAIESAGHTLKAGTTDRWILTAQLRNVGNQPYPGGGRLRLWRNGVGMALPPITPKGELGISAPGALEPLQDKPLPSIGPNAVATLQFEVAGRARYTLRLEPATGPGGMLLDAHAGNNERIVDLLRKDFFKLGALLNLALRPQLEQTKVRIDATGDKMTYVDLPGFVKLTTTIPPFEKLGAVYTVRRIHSKSAQFSYEKFGGRLCIDFETDESEVEGTGPGPDELYPDINADALRLCLRFEIGYDQHRQYFLLGQPQATVNANWSFNTAGVLDWILEAITGALADINKRMEEVVEGALGSQMPILSLVFNRMIHEQFLVDAHGNRGRILGVSFDEPSEEIIVHYEGPR